MNIAATASVCLMLAFALSACATGVTTASGYQPIAATPTTDPGALDLDYRIGPLDKLTISVFQMEDLTLKEARVDASGTIVLPLIGPMMASGKTAGELATAIADRLKESYLQSPQVSVIVDEAVNQRVTVDGAVIEPGVFEMKGRTTLMQAVAMAKGPGRNANLKKVAVFRNLNGQRNVAIFDLVSIRAGKAEDPPILGNDVVVVDGSVVKGFARELFGVLPALAIFRPF